MIIDQKEVLGELNKTFVGKKKLLDALTGFQDAAIKLNEEIPNTDKYLQKLDVLRLACSNISDVYKIEHLTGLSELFKEIQNSKYPLLADCLSNTITACNEIINIYRLSLIFEKFEIDMLKNTFNTTLIFFPGNKENSDPEISKQVETKLIESKSAFDTYFKDRSAKATDGVYESVKNFINIINGDDKYKQDLRDIYNNVHKQLNTSKVCLNNNIKIENVNKKRRDDDDASCNTMVFN